MKYRANLLPILLSALLASATLTGCAAISGQETASEYVDDAAITAKVKMQILDDPTLKSAQISVETMENVVQLSGFVDSSFAVNRAGDLARGVPGVRALRNDLVVR